MARELQQENVRGKKVKGRAKDDGKKTTNSPKTDRDDARAYERVWLLGEQFLFNTHEQFFINTRNENGKLPYILAHYDASCYCNPLTDDSQPGNILNGIRNLLITAIQEQSLLPKVILLIFDDDIMDTLDHYNTGIMRSLGRLVKWQANELHKVVVSYKDMLPSKSRKFKYPHFL